MDKKQPKKPFRPPPQQPIDSGPFLDRMTAIILVLMAVLFLFFEFCRKSF
jgi:hypothetical protein